MVKTYKQIAEELRQGQYTNNPIKSADDLSILAGEYAWLSGQLEDVLQRKPAIWNQLRKDLKSDTATERAWEQTESGTDEMGLRIRMRAIEKMISALKSLISVAEGQARNQF